MKALSLHLLTILGLTICLLGCEEKKEELELAAATDYMQLQPGKYITYRLDSTVFTNLGRATEVHSYEEKHLVEAQITDNLGRTSYRVFRYLRDTTGNGPWNAAGSYMITPLAQSIEVIEDNLRVIKLITPIQEGTTWRGNRYLPTDPYDAEYEFSNDDNIADWEFQIASVGESLTLNGQTINDVITLVNQDEMNGDPAAFPDTYAARNLSVEQYAKGLGMVFQEFVMWEYQPNDGGTPYTRGFGVKRSMIDHN